jgi:hypothetical protein
VVHHNGEGAKRMGVAYFPHGVPRVNWFDDGRSRERSARCAIGSYGIFGPFRNLRSIIEVCRRTQSRLIGSFYCDSDGKRRDLIGALGASGISYEVGTDFPADVKLLRRLSACDLLYLPREKADMWSTSGAARIGMNLRIPIIVSNTNCYADLGDAVWMVENDDEAVEVVMRLRNESVRLAAVERIARFVGENRLGAAYARLLSVGETGELASADH